MRRTTRRGTTSSGLRRWKALRIRGSEGRHSYRRPGLVASIPYVVLPAQRRCVRAMASGRRRGARGRREGAGGRGSAARRQDLFNVGPHPLVKLLTAPRARPGMTSRRSSATRPRAGRPEPRACSAPRDRQDPELPHRRRPAGCELQDLRPVPHGWGSPAVASVLGSVPGTIRIPGVRHSRTRVRLNPVQHRLLALTGYVHQRHPEADIGVLLRLLAVASGESCSAARARPSWQPTALRQKNCWAADRGRCDR
jgi:hypothetical protein